MRRTLPLLAAAWTMLATAAEAPRITILPTGEALVAEVVPVPPGPAGRFDIPLPDTLATSSMVATLERAGAPSEPLTLLFDPPLDGLPALLTGCIGKPVRLLPPGPQAEVSGLPERAELVAGGDPALVRAGGEVFPVRAERVVCSAEGDGRVRAGVLLPERKAAASLRLRYRIGGVTWQVRHRLDLDESGTKGRLAATAQLEWPRGVRFDNAQLRLAEGDVPKVQEATMDAAPKMMRSAMAPAAGGAAPSPSSESSTLDLLLFDIPGRWDFAGPRRMSLPLRSPASVDVDDVLVLDLQRWMAPGNEFMPLAPRRHLRFRVPGDGPLPGGVIEIGVQRADGTWIPLGDVNTPRVAAGRTTEAVLGEVRDVPVEYRQSAVTELREGRFQRETTIELKLANRRDRPAKLELVQWFGAAFQLVDSSVAPAKQDATRVTWNVTLAPGAETTLTYRARVDPRPVRP